MIKIDSNETLFTALAKHPQMWRITRSYVGLFQNAVDSLNACVKLSKERVYNLPSYTFLVNEWGLTGICMGFALQCVKHVRRHRLHNELPPLTREGIPTDMIKHLERLLVLAVYSSLKKGQDPKKLTRTQENRETIGAISRTYQRLVFQHTGISTIETLPGPSFFETEPMRTLLFRFEDLCTSGDLTEDDHFLFIMNPPNFPLFEWHVIYANPKLGVIGDGAFDLLWTSPSKSEGFAEIFQNFVEANGYHSKDVVVLRVREETAPSCFWKLHTPFYMSRVFRRIETSHAIGMHSGFKARFQYLATINRHNRAVLAFFPDVEDIKTNLKNLTVHMDKGTVYYSDLLTFISRNLHGISRLDSKYMNYDLHIIPYWPRTREEIDEVLKTLTEIQNLGPRAHLISSHFQKCILRETCDMGSTKLRSNEDVERFRKGILELRKTAYGTPYSLDSLMNMTFPHLYKRRYFEMLMDAGASPNGDPEAYPRGDSPLDALLWSQKQPRKDSDKRKGEDAIMIELFKSRGATPYKQSIE